MNDNQKLLKETALGSRYACESISIAEDYSKDKSMRRLLGKYKDEHRSIGKRAENLLERRGVMRPTLPSAMTKIHTNFSLSIRADSPRVADLMINGCNMGMKSISKAKNRNSAASPEAIALANELIRTERQMMDDMLRFVR